MKSGREARGFDQVSAYMYGDEVAREQGYQPVGFKKCRTRSIGYHLVKDYLKILEKQLTKLLDAK